MIGGSQQLRIFRRADRHQPRLANGLAAVVTDGHGERVPQLPWRWCGLTAVQVDASAFSGPTLASGWDPADVDNGDVAPIEAAMIDAGRIQPTTVNSRRSRTPALDAGRQLALALGLDPVTVTVASAPSGARQLAVVQSAPLIQRLSQMMNASDNVMAECIGREVAAAINRPFPQHVTYQIGVLPSATATVRDAAVRKQYDAWKATYLVKAAALWTVTTPASPAPAL